MKFLGVFVMFVLRKAVIHGVSPKAYWNKDSGLKRTISMGEVLQGHTWVLIQEASWEK